MSEGRLRSVPLTPRTAWKAWLPNMFVVAFSAGGQQRIVTGGSDGTAKVWEAASGTELLTLTGLAQQSIRAAGVFPQTASEIVTCAVFRSDGQGMGGGASGTGRCLAGGRTRGGTTSRRAYCARRPPNRRANGWFAPATRNHQALRLILCSRADPAV